MLRSSAAPAEKDGDGVPDTMEAEYGLNSRDARDTTKVQDSDGLTNLEERLNRTNPTAKAD